MGISEFSPEGLSYVTQGLSPDDSANQRIVRSNLVRGSESRI